ncbi:hypothetical protein [Kaarinaea lacus]
MAAVYLLIFIPTYWIQLGPINFLWFSDIAIILTTIALWLESALIISAMAVGVLLFELAWLVDFFARWLLGIGIFGPVGTSYMFSVEISLLVKTFSFSFHLLLPITLLWSLHRLGYHRQGLLLQTLIAWINYPLCYWFTSPQRNINWVFGPGKEPQTYMPDYLWVLMLMICVPLIVFLPTHLLLQHWFGHKRLNK